ncbi:MAG: hypothetical protein H8E34_14310 [Bacteroidetes bacterium]|nr:hypothetical protein [Bacteroidota bacterium]
MLPGKIKIWFTILLVIISNSGILFAQVHDNIICKFTQTDSSYTFKGSFNIKANPECLLEITFKYAHVRALAPDAKEVLLIGEGSNWNQISYIYQEFIFFRNKTIWHRTLDKENKRVDFTLMSSENNTAVMPQMISSSGYYQIKQQEEYLIVEYYQQCILTEESITKLYLGRAKKDAIKFIHKLSEYAETYCRNKHQKIIN